MKFFETFNFDIIIVLILIASFIMSLYFNLYRQGRRTLCFVLPFIILYFTFNLIYGNVKSVVAINDFFLKITSIFNNQQTAYALIVYFTCYIILSLLIRLIYSMFRVPVQKRVLNKTSKLAKAIGAVLGLVTGYVLGMLLMFVLNPIISINYEKPITKIYINTSNDVFGFTQLNTVQNVNVEKYEKYENIIGKLTGRNTLNHYYDVLDIFTDFENIENNLKNEILPNLTDQGKLLIVESNVLASFNQNYDQLLEYEKGGSLVSTLKSIKKQLEKNIVYLDVYTNLDSYTYDNVSNYLIDNYDELTTKTKKTIIIDLLNLKVEAFQTYESIKENYLIFKPDYVISDIETDVRYFENYINRNFEEVINIYEESFTTKDANIDWLIEKYRKNKEKIDLLNEKLSLSTKLTLSDNSKLFINAKALNNNLISSYIHDVIINPNNRAYNLYSEYVFYYILTKDVDITDFDLDEYLKFESNLDKLIEDNFITTEEAYNVYENLYNDDLYGLLTPELLQEIVELDGKYISKVNLGS